MRLITESADSEYYASKDTGVTIKELKVDGCAGRDSFLMQFQSDVCRNAIMRTVVRELRQVFKKA